MPEASKIHMIRVCTKCKSYIYLNETFKGKERLKKFESNHRGHTLLTTASTEMDNLECGKVNCEDDDPREYLQYQK